MTSTGPSMRGVRSGPVTTTAISSRRSFSGSRPLISQSSQTRFWSLFFSAAGALQWTRRRSGLWIRASGDCRRCPKLRRRMSASLILTYAFAAALVAGLLLKFWLASRQVRHVARHRDAVPPAFAQTITLAAHQKAADYTIAKSRFGMLEMAWSRRVAAGLDLAGRARPAQPDCSREWLGTGMVQQLALLAAFALIGGAARAALHAVADLPAGRALRLQQDDAGACGSPTLLKSALLGAADRPAAGGADPVADGRRRRALVAVGLGRVDGLQPAADAGLPELHRAAVQQVQAARRRHAEGARHGAR